MSTKAPIVVVGAGIAGLSLALALDRRGIAVSIFEAAVVLSEVGAGLQLSPNALRVIDSIGLSYEVAASGTPARSVSLRRATSDRLVARVPVISGDGTPYLSLHRADLQTVLLAAVRACPRITLALDRRLEGASEVEGGLRLVFSCAAGERFVVETPLAVGADGVHSALAAAAGLEGARPTGLTAWRAMIDGPMEHGGLPGITAWLAANRHIVAYPVSRNEKTNIVAIQREATSAEDRGIGAPFDPIPLAPRLAALIARAGVWTPWSILDTSASRPMVLFGGRAVLLGDAAHAMPPFAAQGAALALEDAAVLADCLSTSTALEIALARYEQDRRPRIAAVRRRVAFHRRVYHLPTPLSFGRDAVLALRSPRSLAADLAWLYDWKPPTP